MSFWKRIFYKKRKIEVIDIEHTIADTLNLSSMDSDNFDGRFEKDIERGTFYLVFVLTIFVIIIFLSQLFKLQIIQSKIWKQKAQNNFQEVYPLFAPRGLIKDRNGELLAWNIKDESDDQDFLRRQYIEEEGFSNLLGYVKYPQKDNNGRFWQEDYLAESGIELYYDNILSGKKGNIIFELDAKGNIIKNNIIDKSISGGDVSLTIDKKLQNIFYDNLKLYSTQYNYKGGAGILMKIDTGEILAMASYPDYNNNIFVNPKNDEEKAIRNNYLLNKNSPFIHKAVQAGYVPGSIVKSIMGYLALDSGIVNKNTKILSKGELVIKNIYGGPDTVFKDNRAHGYVNMVEAIAQSSDEYFYQVGGGYKDQKGLGIDNIVAGMSKFLFTKKTNIDFPNEVEGIIPSRDWKEKVFHQPWLLGNTYHTAIGQYGYKVSPISALNSFSFIANNGVAFIPRLLYHKDTDNIQNLSVKLDLNQDYLNIIKEGMNRTVEKGGTANYYDGLPFGIAGKSGTAQVGANNVNINSWFVGYFPRNNPKYSFILFFENGPGTNRVGASKIFRYILDDIIYKTPEYVRDFSR